MKVAIDRREINRLTCPPDKSQTFLWDTVLPGFGLRCTKAGIKSYVVQKDIGGTSRRHTIGKAKHWTLEEARNHARELLRDMDKGVHPREAQALERSLSTSLRTVVNQYIAHKHLAERSKTDSLRLLENSFGDWADLPAREITRSMCERRFDELVKRGKTTASMSFVLLRAWLNYARDTHATDDGEYPILAANPVRLMQSTRTLHKGIPRTSRIPPDKLSAVWAAVQARRGANHIPATRTGADIVTTLLLMGTRIGETLRIEWEHVDLDGKVPSLHIPVNKTHHPVTLPLSTQMVDMLRARKRRKGCPFVFPARDPSSKGHAADPRNAWGYSDPSQWGYVSKAAGLHLSCHALRRTYISAAQACGVELWRAEALTVHAPKSVTLTSYTELSDLRYLHAEQQRISDYLTGAV